MRNSLFGAVVALLLATGLAWAAAPLILTDSAALNAMRPCSYQDQADTNLTISGTSAATATKLAGGKVFRFICSSAVHYTQTSTAAPTATSAHKLLPGSTIEWVHTDASGSYVAAIQDSSGGTCNITLCR